ncbi:MAG TPA: efflux RND transporter periplasmic adaptor subunit [Acetobacteraceae bacterium]|nr:efflux RND transporter periplasmic adaptor subunit [Acetobacteraceae bacterium]
MRAKDEESLAFRIGGRLLERPVHVGDLLKAGQLVGRLDPRDEQNAVRMAEAKLAGDNARLLEAGKTYWRQQELLKNGWTPQARFDQAEQALRSAQAMVDSDRAALRVAQDLLGYTVLFADAPGAVAATGGEPGEVVTAGQMIAKVARQGGRDAVFDVPEQLILTGPRDPVVQVALTNDSGVTATGRVREVAPQADSATRTFEVKVGLIDPPGAMRLGSTVTGRINLAPPPGVEIPATALTESNGRPAVWIVDPRIHTVSLRTVDVLRYDATSVVIGQGLKKGDVVVTAGVQVLRPGQQVRLLGAA